MHFHCCYCAGAVFTAGLFVAIPAIHIVSLKCLRAHDAGTFNTWVCAAIFFFLLLLLALVCLCGSVSAVTLL